MTKYVSSSWPPVPALAAGGVLAAGVVAATVLLLRRRSRVDDHRP
ncbi:hypothetical protein [Actinophytocola glycyrrhizae]|uniref:LPXTG-motif cell wall-anchored protein n=1 Tax=Actinophytocola glycyrrhizae TaxID=2044873 RepID=A0ABV9RS42_9PSEU